MPYSQCGCVLHGVYIKVNIQACPDLSKGFLWLVQKVDP